MVAQRPSWFGALTSRLAELSKAQHGPSAKVGRWRTRFAPSPTGHLHLGHLVNAIYVWGIARAHDGEVLLRIEDHDRIRCRIEYENALLEDLEWLGLDADVHPIRSFRSIVADHCESHPARQSDQPERYDSALRVLRQQGLVYNCCCSRRDVAEAIGNATHGIESVYPGTCRKRRLSESEHPALRMRIDEHLVHFDDIRLGSRIQCPAQQCGDVLLRDRHRQWTYQFAVVVDDIAHEVDLIIRGEDLLESTGRQLQIGELLGRRNPPLFLHHQLLRDANGVKLSKSKRDTAIRDLRLAGWSAEDLLGHAAHQSGLMARSMSIGVQDLGDLFV